jgi:hypothetical protein
MSNCQETIIDSDSEQFFQKLLSPHQRKSGFWAKINYSGHNFSKFRLNQIPFRSLFCYRRKNSAQLGAATR